MTMGFEAAGWECVGHAEIEPHARAVLRYQWPEVPLHGDVAQLDGTTLPEFDLLTFGAPCQDLSIAGKRAGMTEGSGTRSSLFFEAIRIWKESSAPLALYENVLGAYSSNNGKDFAAVLSAFVGAAVPVPADGWRGAGVAAGPAGIAAWRTVDLQHFGWDGDTTPQRRRRVFVLGTRTGDYDPAEVLLVADGLLGNLASSGEAGEGTAEDAPAGTHGPSLPTGFSTTGSVGYVHDIMPSLPHLTGLNCPGAQMMGVLAKDAVASVDGESRGAIAFKSGQSEAAGGTFVTDYAPTLQGAANGSTMVPAVLTYEWHNQDSRIKPVDVASSLNLNAEGREGHIVLPLTPQAVILRNREGKPGGGKGPLLSAERSLTLGTSNDQVVFTKTQYGAYDEAPSVDATLGARDHASLNTDLALGVGVPRRLMPTETERLMGWPSGHTAMGTDEQGRDYALSDTARYKLCGNGVGSPVTAWIGMRLKLALDTQ
jgi:DNA (cytosine-5)-methyltransferase 1